MSDPRIVRDLLDGVVDRIHNPVPGLMTGLTDLDRVTYGIHAKQLTVIAGRPSMGKSALALDIALNLGYNRQQCAFFTLEDSADMVVRRLLSKDSKVSMVTMRDNSLDDNDRLRLQESIDRMRSLPLHIDDVSAMTPATIYRKVETLKNKFDIKAVFIDYMQLMQLGDRNRQEGLEEAAGMLKDMSKTFDVAVIVMSQLNRKPDERDNHEPRMSDLRGSGGIEQSADLCLLLYRPAYYTMQEIDIDSEDDGEAFIIIGKHKNGPCGKVRCGYVADWMQFMDAPDQKLPQSGSVF